MKDILSLLQEWFKIFGKFFYIDLRGLCGSSVRHAAIELIEGDRFSEIIRIFDAVQLKVEADIGNVAVAEMFLT